ncbi:hypothetical protein V6N12_009249 [Hibiscus sabdariffa]|uniref:Uncharacterized protein n=1 Tax=Hibiscus sabdariffa TaxID=183260 RepID=A0ABR2BJ23_9ROSI
MRPKQVEAKWNIRSKITRRKKKESNLTSSKHTITKIALPMGEERWRKKELEITDTKGQAKNLPPSLRTSITNAKEVG